jgi:DNA-binding beta-propeller fold protein YncE
VVVRRRAFLLSLFAVLAFLAAAGGAAWWFLTPKPAPDPTEGRWPPFVTTISGRGVPGDHDGAWDVAEFSDPFAVAVDSQGRVFVADAGDANRIRRIETDRRVVTLAGGSGEGWRDGRRGLAAFHTPSGLALAPDGTLFVADTGTHVIRRISPDGVVTTVAGSGTPGWRDGPGREAAFDGPMGIALAPDGRLLVADAYNHRIRVVDRHSVVSTLAGSGVPGLLDGMGAAAQFDTPCGVAVGKDGVIYVADTGNSLLRRIDGTGAATTMFLVAAGVNEEFSLVRPVGIAAGSDGRLAVTDRRGRVLQVWPDGTARTLAGSLPGFADGPGRSARLHAPAGVAIDTHGAVIVADAGNYLLRRIAPPGLPPVDPPRSPLSPRPGYPVDSLRDHVVPWPLDPQYAWHEVAGTMGEARGSVTSGRERFHAGIDVQADPGTIVRAVHGAKVDAPIAANNFGDLNENVTIGPFTYVHIRAGRDHRDASLDPATFPVVPLDPSGVPGRVILRRGTRILEGDPIGTVNRFAHVHLNAGTPGREVNALTLPLAGFVDTVPPTIAPKGVTLYDEAWAPFSLRARGATLVRGRVRIVVDAWDQVDGNAPRRRLGLYRLAYQVLAPGGTPLPGFERPRPTVVFDRLPADSKAAFLVYAEGTGISVYGNRRTRFLYVATTHVVDGEASEGFWDTSSLSPGPYTLRAIAADIAGNETARDVPVWVETASSVR